MLPAALAYCGLYCGACPVGLANERGAVGEFAAERDCPPEIFACDGCRSETVARHCASCTVRVCARARGVELCLDCTEYPCEDFVLFRDDPRYPYHVNADRDMRAARQEGLERWVELQRERWSCDACDAHFAWEDTACGSCGAPVRNYAAP